MYVPEKLPNIYIDFAHLWHTLLFSAFAVYRISLSLSPYYWAFISLENRLLDRGECFTHSRSLQTTAANKIRTRVAHRRPLYVYCEFRFEVKEIDRVVVMHSEACNIKTCKVRPDDESLNEQIRMQRIHFLLVSTGIDAFLFFFCGSKNSHPHTSRV